MIDFEIDFEIDFLIDFEIDVEFLAAADGVRMRTVGQRAWYYNSERSEVPTRGLLRSDWLVGAVFATVLKVRSCWSP